jgi:RNA polymerase sigma-70 factor, ECF subfamily
MIPQDTEELTALWTTAQPAVTAFIRTLVPDRNESEELLQETAVVLVRRFQEYDRHRPFVAWAIGIAKMKILTYQREKALTPIVFDADLVEHIAEDCQQLAKDDLPFYDLLIKCVTELDARAQKAIRLRYADEMGTPRIAETLGVSHGAARMLLTRARTALRLCVEKYLKQVKAYP